MRLIGILILFLSCTSQQTPAEIQTIDTSELLQLIENEENLVILDVRTRDETSQGMIPGAINLDWYDAGFENGLSDLDTEQPVVVYCATGIRSSQAASKLKALEFKKIYNYRDGYNGWINK